MKNLYTTFVLLFTAVYIHAQIIPTEIMYNPPESGNDSLEYLEIYNTTDQAIPLNGYSFSQGFVYTFGDDTIQAKSYYLLAVNDTALFNVLGVMADAEWESNALSNGGESIELLDADSNMVFSMEYDDSNPWPDAADGNGPSIELCDLQRDYTDPSSWGAANTATGSFIAGLEIFGTPGAPNDSDCGVAYDHRVEVSSNVFTPADLTINLGETVLWENVDGEHNVDGRQQTYPDNPESFYSGPASLAPWQFTHTFTEEGFYNYECNPHVAIGMIGTITVVDPNPAPLYDIATVTTNDANGVPDSLGVECKLQGVIHGANRRDGGYEFALIDQNGDGITVFSSGEIDNYSAQEGDSLEVEGFIGQFNGMTQINATDVDFFVRGNALNDARIVSALGEDTESEYIVMEGVEFVDPSDWEGNGSSFNIDIRHVSTDVIWTMRVDSDVPLANVSEPPMGANGEQFNIRGIGGQFDRSEPYFDGYQIFPSSVDDFMMASSSAHVYQLNATVYPNPVSDVLSLYEIPAGTEHLNLVNQFGQTVLRIDQVSTRMNIPVGHLTPGTYYILTEHSGDLYYQKWIKQ